MAIVRTSMRLAATRGMGIGAAHVLTGLRRSEPWSLPLQNQIAWKSEKQRPTWAFSFPTSSACFLSFFLHSYLILFVASRVWSSPICKRNDEELLGSPLGLSLKYPEIRGPKSRGRQRKIADGQMSKKGSCFLVGGLEPEFYFSIQLGMIIPTDFHIFQRGWNHQPEVVFTCFSVCPLSFSELYLDVLPRHRKRSLIIIYPSYFCKAYLSHPELLDLLKILYFPTGKSPLEPGLIPVGSFVSPV